jgi:hypothetical protein
VFTPVGTPHFAPCFQSLRNPGSVSIRVGGGATRALPGRYQGATGALPGRGSCRMVAARAISGR